LAGAPLSPPPFFPLPVDPFSFSFCQLGGCFPVETARIGRPPPPPPPASRYLLSLWETIFFLFMVKHPWPFRFFSSPPRLPRFFCQIMRFFFPARSVCKSLQRFLPFHLAPTFSLSSGGLFFFFFPKNHVCSRALSLPPPFFSPGGSALSFPLNFLPF